MLARVSSHIHAHPSAVTFLQSKYYVYYVYLRSKALFFCERREVCVTRFASFRKRWRIRCATSSTIAPNPREAIYLSVICPHCGDAELFGNNVVYCQNAMHLKSFGSFRQFTMNTQHCVPNLRVRWVTIKSVQGTFLVQ